MMKYNTVIFDMDGLLIDSEPLWYEAANEVFAQYGKHLSAAEYADTTGLRTKEFVEWWFTKMSIPPDHADEAKNDIIKLVIKKVKQKAKPLPGLQHIFNFFITKKYKIGLATSSPVDLINEVIDYLKIKNYLQAISSAEDLPFGKPHPQVYLNCADSLGVSPAQCICFEDSFNGMIAAKAAK
ncbi:MAG: hexitol phosphatase HxpB [Chitinophagaceae bacterium]|nr:hexitol phosphatase HxpB [Chitinophagaceae bacterium]